MNAQRTGQAAQYLRRSVERDKAADQDKGAGQRRANAIQAANDGAVITRTFDGDWGTSGGRGKRDKRAAMAELIEAIRAGVVSTVYVHTTDRLARDVEYGMALWNACKDAGTILRPGTQTFDPREPGYLTLWTVLLAQAEEDLDRMTRKNVDVIAWRVEHIATCKLPGRTHMGRCHIIGCTDGSHCRYSHRIGHPFYGERPGEDLGAVVTAYREARTVMGACRLLNGRAIPTRMGGPWSTISVREILVRHGAMAHRTRPGAKAQAPFMFYGLLRCHCGHILTGSRYRNGSDPVYTTYKCHWGRTTPDHGLGSVPERVILPLIRAEVERLRLPVDAVTMAADNATQRSVLAGRLERANELYIAGTITRERREVEASAVAAELDRLGDAEAVVAVPTIRPEEWDTWAPADLNAYIRAILLRVDLGPDMRPVEAIWRNPALRR